MKNKKTRTLAISLVLLMALMLSACGNANTPSNTSPTSSPDSQTTPPASTAPSSQSAASTSPAASANAVAFDISNVVAESYSLKTEISGDTLTVTIHDENLAEVYQINKNLSFEYRIECFSKDGNGGEIITIRSDTSTPGEWRMDNNEDLELWCNNNYLADGNLEFDYANKNMIATFKITDPSLETFEKYQLFLVITCDDEYAEPLTIIA